MRVPVSVHPSRVRETIAAAWVFLLVAASGSADDAVQVADLVAEDAIAYLELSQADRILDHLYSPQVQTLIEAAPGLKKQLSERSPRELRQAAEHIGRSVGLSASRLVRELTAGGVSAAFEGPDRFLVAAQARDAALLAKAHAALLDLARQDAKQKDKPDPIRSTDYHGVAIHQFSENDAHALVGGALLASNKRDMLERAIDRLQNRTDDRKPLSSDEIWTARHAELPTERAGWAFARLDRIRALNPSFMKGKPQDEPGAKFLLGPWFEALQKSDWACLLLKTDSKHLELELALPVPEGSKEGPLQAYRPPSGQGALAPLRPPGTLLSVSLWRDFSAVWEVRDQFLPPEALQGFAQLDTAAGQFFGGRDFGTGVLGALGADWRVVVVQQDYDKLNPKPDLKFPGAAILLDLKPEDEEFPIRLQAAFQSFVGLVNIGQAQQKGPPLMLGSEEFEGVTISKSAYLASSAPEPGKPIDPRFNFSPCAARVGDTFVIASSLDVTHAVIHALKEAGEGTAAKSEFTLLAEADGAEAAKLVEVNRASLVMRNMLEKGNAKQAAEEEIDLLAKALRFLGAAKLSINDSGPEVRVRLSFDLGN